MIISTDNLARESLLAFWAEAGVDACLLDAPIDRTRIIAPAPVLKTVATAPRPGRIAVEGAAELAEAVAEARRQAAAADSLEALGEAIAGFDGCPLKRMGARQAVFRRGSPEAPLLVIGEGPGAEEDQRGQPFVGKAGRLLDRMLAAAGLADRVLITNTVFWRPPGNRTPTPEEQAVCAPFVERAHALLKPRAVLLLGAAAAKSILRTEEGITRIRGQWREWRPDGAEAPSPVLPTLHPAFLLRQPQAKALAWADLLDMAARLDEA